ncbi:MAG: Transcriptional regulator, AraC family [Rhizobiaceae bacterium]|nr:Transcriptional regulator, AraC family [Rhizobiaceae bacterium]
MQRNNHAASELGAGKDVLSDVLRVIKLSAALFFQVEASSPWSVEVPESGSFAGIILPGARHVISYHVITSGSGWISTGEDSPLPFSEGDVLVIPHGDGYAMRHAPGHMSGLSTADSLEFFRAMAAGKLPFLVLEGGGGPALTRYVCGFLGCDSGPFNPLLGALPRLMRVPRSSNGRGDLLDRLIDIALSEAPRQGMGADCIRLRLSELLFVEVVRRYLDGLPPGQTGWLAGLRDPAVGRTLAMIHGNPARNWRLEQLARKAGASRSVLAARFTRLVGCPPIQYLARWRVQVAASLLSEGNARISAVGREVGYASEAAFSRSFKKIAAVSPAEWRAAGRP